MARQLGEVRAVLFDREAPSSMTSPPIWGTPLESGASLGPPRRSPGCVQWESPSASWATTRAWVAAR